MNEPKPQRPGPRRFQFGIRLALLLAVLGLGGLLVWLRASPWANRPVRILLVVPPPDPEAGLSHYQARALALFIQDALEANPAQSVTIATAVPEHPETLRGPKPWLMLKVLPRRQQDRLGLAFHWKWDQRLAEDWEKAEILPGPPRGALREALQTLPLAVDLGRFELLFPGSDAALWELVQAGTLRLQNSDLEEATRLARTVTEGETRCVEGWFLLGSLTYRSLLDAPGQGQPNRLAEAEACFTRGLALFPHHPRGAFQLAQLKTNEGDHRAALDLLLEALKERPHNPLLLAGVVYSARNAGLLELARAAADRMDRWAFSDVQPLTIDVLFLYLGDLPRFEATLRDQPGHLRTGVQRFFKGYLALIRKQPEQAIEALKAAESVPRGYPHYIALARSFRLAAQGALPEARQALRELERDRVGLQVPDGEFTLRMAEGNALIGDTDHAMELTERAFAQGFGAAAWFENSPFLAPLRQSPRWRALMQHVHQRQNLLESRFPVRRLPGE